MKAIVLPNYGPPDIIELREVEKPHPGKNELLIKVHAAAITTADCALRKGEPWFARLFFGLFKPKTPIPGTEFSGVIEAVGENVSLFQPGDPIYAATGTEFGAHQEYLCMPQDGALCLKPTNLDFPEAAALAEGALTALPFLRDHGNIKAGSQVLINGASGSVGTAAVQLAKYFGAEVTAVCGTQNQPFVKSLGADHSIDYTAQDFTQLDQQYDIIFDAVGKSSFKACRKILKPTGIYLTTVIQLSMLGRMLWGKLIGRKQALFAATGLRTPELKQADLRFLKDLIESEKLIPTIEKIYSPEEVSNAHQHIDQGHKVGNIVLVWP